MAAAEVEVDEDTGRVKLLRYVSIADVGKAINPRECEAQEEGAAMMGIGHTFFEQMVYEGGQLLTSTMTNYEVPAAPDVPAITIGRSETPSTTNELGVKGVGETGTIASPPAVVNAVIDALSHLGVTDMERPMSPERVWRAVREAKAEAKGGGKR